jgi:hypothetical protein
LIVRGARPANDLRVPTDRTGEPAAAISPTMPFAPKAKKIFQAKIRQALPG